FAGCSLGDEAARQFAATSPYLEELDLGSCDRLGADGLRALLAAPALGGLRSLAIPYALPLEELAGRGRLTPLSSLKLQGRGSGSHDAAGWERLFASPHLRNLTSFEADLDAPLSTSAAVALVEAPWAGQLHKLALTGEYHQPAELARLFSPSAPG